MWRWRPGGGAKHALKEDPEKTAAQVYAYCKLSAPADLWTTGEGYREAALVRDLPMCGNCRGALVAKYGPQNFRVYPQELL